MEKVKYSEEETRERAGLIGRIGQTIPKANAMFHDVNRSVRIEMGRGRIGDLIYRIIFSADGGVVVERLVYRIMPDGSIQKEGYLDCDGTGVYYSDRNLGKGQRDCLDKPPLEVETSELRNLAEFVKDPTYPIGILRRLRRLPRPSAVELTDARRAL